MWLLCQLVSECDWTGPSLSCACSDKETAVAPTYFLTVTSSLSMPTKDPTWWPLGGGEGALGGQRRRG